MKFCVAIGLLLASTAAAYTGVALSGPGAVSQWGGAIRQYSPCQVRVLNVGFFGSSCGCPKLCDLLVLHKSVCPHTFPIT